LAVLDQGEQLLQESFGRVGLAVDAGDGDGVAPDVEVDALVAACNVAEVLVRAAEQGHERPLVGDGDRRGDLAGWGRAVDHRLRPSGLVATCFPGESNRGLASAARAWINDSSRSGRGTT